MDEQQRQTARVWEADLGEAGRKLTLEELSALELMHLCHMMSRLAVAQEEMGLHLASLEGRFDRLERFLMRLDPERYPQGPTPGLTALPPGGAAVTMQGVDVSSHQGSVDWAGVAGSGVGFCFVKSTGGSWYRNPYHAEQIAGARAAGLVVGHYHYAFESSGDPFPGRGPEAEADYFLAAVQSLGPILAGDLLVLDIEEAPSDIDAGAWALRWLGRVRDRVGYRPLCYTGRWFSDSHGFGAHVALSGYPLWLAAYQETPTEPVAPWASVAFWQFTDKATVPGIAAPCDLNLLTEEAGPIALYGQPAGLPDVDVPIAVGPHYDSHYPAIAQNDDWSCAPTSMRWALWAYGRTPAEGWLESSMINEGVVSPALGLLDATGRGLAAWATRHYGEFNYRGEHDPSVEFDDVAAEASEGRHPLCLGGRNWYHWSGVRGFDGTRITLANPAPGYKGVAQTLSREQWAYLGPWSMVRLVHDTESSAPDPAPIPPTVPTRWTRPTPSRRGATGCGPGLLEMMAADQTVPAQRASTWYPFGASPSDVETCYGENAVLYYWLMKTGRGYRVRPSS